MSTLPSRLPEIYFGAGQTVFFGLHPTGRPYQWMNGSPALRDMDDLPEVGGFEIQRFLRGFGGPEGKGDPTAQYGKGTGAIVQFLRIAHEMGIMIVTLEDVGKVVRRCQDSPLGRHPTACLAIAYSRSKNGLGRRDEEIDAVLRPAYLGVFDGMSIKEQQKRHRDFNDMMGWAYRKVIPRETFDPSKPGRVA